MTAIVDLDPEKMAIRDARRERELFRYIQPTDLIPGGSENNDDDDHDENTSNIATGLAPFCELVALRCKSPKVLLNVMDKKTMYFLSSAAARQEGDDIELCEDPVMRACSGAVSLEGRVCEMTIQLTATGDSIPMFVVNDLANSKFKNLDVVTGPPYFRFYAGTPITTRDGLTIGSLAFLDTKARDGLTQMEERCLGRTALQSLLYLETNRQAMEGRRSMRLARSLDGFLEGKKSLERLPLYPRNDLPENFYGFPTSHQIKTGAQNAPNDGGNFSFDPESLLTHESESDDSQELARHRQGRSKDDIGHESQSQVLGRAANLLRQGIGPLGEDGSVMFVSLRNHLLGSSSRASIPVAIDAASTASQPFLSGGARPSLVLEEEVLAGLIRRHPGGHLFALDDTDASSNEEDEDPVAQSRRKSEKAHEIEALRSAFPHVHQLLFAPLWDSDVGAFVHAVFTTNSARDRSLSPTPDLSFLNSFCSSVASECARLEAQKADKQKSDFVGTISHEMRSPLHGILASIEFMNDTTLGGYQRSLLDTVQSCGRTLLDTINNVLDFSKINTFRTNWQAENKRTQDWGIKKRHLGSENVSSQGLSISLQLSGVVDIGAMLEEVVDTVVMGQNFASIPEIAVQTRQLNFQGPKVSNDLCQDPVQVYIDVAKADWAFVTQPGAIRRIMLNLAGNALKYTAKGRILVQLELNGTADDDANAMVLTVSDTGKGISPKFLSTLIYVPFAQENVLAPGSGLGLSIVNNIVMMLGGTIDIQSEVGKGTTAKVIVPLRRSLPRRMSTSTTNTTTSSSSPTTPQSDENTSPQVLCADESVILLQNKAAGLKAVIYRPKTPGDDFEAVMSKYVSQWYGFDLIHQIGDADVIITDEGDLDDLIPILTRDFASTRTPVVAALCSLALRNAKPSSTNLDDHTKVAIEWVPKPVGPYKLAKSIWRGLHRTTTNGSPLIDVDRSTPTTENFTPIHDPPVSPSAQLNGLADGMQGIAFDKKNGIYPVQFVNVGESIPISQINRHVRMINSSPKQEQDTASRSTQTGSYPFPNLTHESVPDKINQKDTVQSSDTASLRPRLSSRTNGDDSSKSSGTTRSVNPRVLVVDDNKINSNLLKTFLRRKRKYTQTDFAENGQEAVDAYTGSAPGARHDIIFMDISMPVMGGFEATRIIRDFEKHNNNEHVHNGALVIALTGLASARDQAEGLEAGIDIYLIKPVSLKTVGDLLDNWERHQESHQARRDGALRNGTPPTKVDVEIRSIPITASELG